MMQFDVAQHGDVVVISLSGDVMGGPDGSTLHNKLHELRSAGSHDVVVDLDGVLREASGYEHDLGVLWELDDA